MGLLQIIRGRGPEVILLYQSRRLCTWLRESEVTRVISRNAKRHLLLSTYRFDPAPVSDAANFSAVILMGGGPLGAVLATALNNNPGVPSKGIIQIYREVKT